MQLALPLRGYDWRILAAIPRVLAVVMVAWVAFLTVPWQHPGLVAPGSGDMAAYLMAADRLQGGAPLYIDNVADTYWYLYAPWFAFAWVPLTWLPVEIVDPLWTLGLLGCAIYLLAPWWVYRHRLEAWLLFGLAGAGIGQAVMVGNAQLVAVALVAFGMGRREGPLWVALGASLKPSGLAFALVYAARREWGRFALTLGLTALLWAPALWFGVEHYPATGLDTFGLVVAGLAGLAALAAAGVRSRWMVPVASVAATLGSHPQPYSLTWLLVAQDRQQHLRDAGEGVVHGPVALGGGEVHEGVAAHLS